MNFSSLKYNSHGDFVGIVFEGEVENHWVPSGEFEIILSMMTTTTTTIIIIIIITMRRMPTDLIIKLKSQIYLQFWNRCYKMWKLLKWKQDTAAKRRTEDNRIQTMRKVETLTEIIFVQNVRRRSKPHPTNRTQLRKSAPSFLWKYKFLWKLHKYFIIIITLLL